MNIELHIERLVVEGIPIAPAERALLHTAIHAELERLLRAEGLPGDLPRRGAVARAQAPPVVVPGRPDTLEMGRRLAVAIHEGLRS
jgi:hypothetical protein